MKLGVKTYTFGYGTHGVGKLSSLPAVIFCVNSHQIRKLQNQKAMLKHWYVYIIIAVVAELLLLVCDKYKIIKSKPLRYFIVIFVSAFICFGAFDLIVGE